MISTEDLVWRAKWIADVKRRAPIEIPALLRAEAIRRLQPITPLPDLPARLPHTGAMRKLDTEMISAVKLLPVDVRDTRELVSSAVRWFYQKHGCLPTSVSLNPMRCLAIAAPDFFTVAGCEDLDCYGCYTVSIESDATLSSDIVRLRFWEGIEDSYL